MNKVDRFSLGYRLRFARETANLKQQDLADKLDISKRTLINWEKNKSAPSDPVVNKIAEIASCSAKDLLLGPAITERMSREGIEDENIRLQKELLETQRKVIKLLEEKGDCWQKSKISNGKTSFLDPSDNGGEGNLPPSPKS